MSTARRRQLQQNGEYSPKIQKTVHLSTPLQYPLGSNRNAAKDAKKTYFLVCLIEFLIPRSEDYGLYLPLRSDSSNVGILV